MRESAVLQQRLRSLMHQRVRKGFMSIKDRFDAALKVIQEHNEAVGGENQPGYVNGEEFIALLKATGATSEDRLRGLSHEAILDLLPEIKVGTRSVKPVILAKAIAGVFRFDNASPEKRPIASRQVDRMNLRELVENLDPEEYTNKVAEALQKIAQGRRFVVFGTGRNVDVEATFNAITALKQGFIEVDIVTVNKQAKEVFRLGELPDVEVDENPFYEGRPLRPDSTCDQTGRSWEGISLENRQLVRLAIKTGELEVSFENIHNIMDLLLNGHPPIRERYRKAAIEFDKLAAKGQLPSMKVALKVSLDDVKKKNVEPVNNPLIGGKKVKWVPEQVKPAPLPKWVPEKAPIQPHPMQPKQPSPLYEKMREAKQPMWGKAGYWCIADESGVLKDGNYTYDSTNKSWKMNS